MSDAAARWERVESGAPEYPPALVRLLGDSAPAALFARGDPALLRLPLTALFCSVRVPAELVLPTYDLARSLRDAAIPVIGGFQSPLERECLELLLRGSQPVVVSPARAIGEMRLRPAWEAAMREGRLLIVSRFEGGRRPTRALAAKRNRLVAALAGRLCVAHASPGGSLHPVVREALSWGKPVACLSHPDNRDLLLMGAVPLAPGAGAEVVHRDAAGAPP